MFSLGQEKSQLEEEKYFCRGGGSCSVVSSDILEAVLWSPKNVRRQRWLC